VQYAKLQHDHASCEIPGSLPAIGDEVQVTGSFVQVQGSYLFAANDVKVLRHHQVGSRS